jgi:predicted Rossmann fold flavoprotein
VFADVRCRSSISAFPDIVPRRVIVIGAGAAGSMAAIFAAAGGAETILLERTRDGGRKILISGGGRCNILPMHVDESRFVTDSSVPLLRRIVRSWPLAGQIGFFEREVNIPLVAERETSKLFPASHRAHDVRDGLLRLAAKRGVAVVTGTHVRDARPARGSWRVEIEGREPVDADAVVVATGGLSVPSTGSDGMGLALAQRLGHEVHPTYPALTPLLAVPAPFGSLAGVSLPVTITARSGSRRVTASGGFLFTHQGYSGPAVLDVSHVAVRSREGDGAPAELRVRWAPLGEGEWETALRAQGSRTVLGGMRAHLPERLAIALLEAVGIDPATSLSSLRRPDRVRLVETLVRGVLPWTGHEGYKKAEVTGGGVSLSEIHPRTMESRRHPGLFLCGEMLDAFGPIGGYNFLWAWATGRAAGIGAAAEGHR